MKSGSSVSGGTLQLLLVLVSLTLGDAAGNSVPPSTTVDWDIVVTQGNGVALISTSSSSTQDPREITFPMPKLPTNTNRSQLMSVISLDGDISGSMEKQLISYEELEKDWPHFEVKSLVSDASRNLFYFSHSITTNNYKLTNLCVFNLTSLETKLLLQTSSGSVDNLDLHEGNLYFKNGRNEAILKLPTADADFLQPNSVLPTIIVKRFQESAVNSFVIGPSPSRTLFWSAGNPSTIYYEEGEEKVFVSTGLRKVSNLHIFGHQLYFMNTPQFGPEKKIERVSLSNASEREILVNFESMNQMPIGFTCDCEFLYWTDALSKALWRIPLSPKSKVVPTKIYTSTKVNRHFNPLFPHAVTTRLQYQDHPGCIPNRKSLPEVTSTPIPLTAATLAQSYTLDSVIPPSSTPLQESDDLVIHPSPTPQRIPISGALIGSSTGSPSKSLPLNVRLCEEEQHGACLNGATCLYWDENLFCLCPEGFTGPRCETALAQGVSKTRIGGAGSEESAETCSSTNAFLLLILTAVGGVAVALSVLAIILGVKVHRLSRKPRVHRRFIVARPDAQRSRHPSTNLCEMIDIENCCNMTICETPCYDSGTGRVSLVNESLGHGDKERLLNF